MTEGAGADIEPGYFQKKITEKELNPNTNEYEDVDYYVFKGNKKVRVTTIISESNKKTFANVSQDEVAKALREAKMQKGTDVHKAIQEILERYKNRRCNEVQSRNT